MRKGFMRKRGFRSFGKKGVSPLIATVLIIGFTIAIAALIFGWGGSFVKKTTEETGKSAMREVDTILDANVEIKSAGNVGGLLGINVINNGKTEIKRFKVKVYGADSSAGYGETNSGVGAYSGANLLVGITGMPEKIAKVELYSIAEEEGEEVVSRTGFSGKNIIDNFKSPNIMLYMNFDDGSAKDLSGNANPALHGMVSFTDETGKGKVAQFTGEGGGYIKMPYYTALNLQKFTISALIYHEALSGNYDGVIGNGRWTSAGSPYTNGGFTEGFEMRFAPSSTTFDCSIGHPFSGSGPTVYGYKASTVIGDKIWAHVAITFNGTALIGYKDGVIVRIVQPISGSYPSNLELRVGAGELNSPSNVFNGKIDEVMIVNRALTVDEVKGMSLYYGL